MKSRKNKKTLRNYFVKDTEKTKLQNDKKLTDSFKIISLYIFMFLCNEYKDTITERLLHRYKSYLLVMVWRRR